MLPTSVLPKPDESWPTWAVWLYWIVVGVAIAFVVIKTIVKSCHKVPQMHWGIRQRLNQPIRKNPRRKDEPCDICDARAATGCPWCTKNAYCVTCTYCPVHDELDLRPPGFKVQMPFTHGYHDSDCREQPFDLGAFAYSYETAPGESVKVIIDGDGHYAVSNNSRAVYAANYAAADLQKSVVIATKTALRRAVEELGVHASTDAISIRTVELFDSSQAFEVQLTRFNAEPITPAPEQVLASAIGQKLTSLGANVLTGNFGAAAS